MNEENKGTTTKGIGATTLLTIVFVVLKLCHVINWAWVWVLFPTIFAVGFGIICWLIILILAVKK